MRNRNISKRRTHRSCSATIKTNSAKIEIVADSSVHRHNPLNENEIQRLIIHNSCKRKASDSISDRPSEIIRTQLQSIENATSATPENIDNIRRSKYRVGKKSIQIASSS
jgi:hypothetical protein